VTVSAELAREAFARREWRDAYRLFRESGTSEARDLEQLAIVSYLVGEDVESAKAWEAAHRAFLDAGDRGDAARCAAWLGLLHMLRGETAQGGGWLARADRIVEEIGPECTARGYLLVPAFLASLESGDAIGADGLATEIVTIARGCGDPDLFALGVLARGQATLARGNTNAGLRLLDEAMVAVTAGEVSPIPSGIVYCAVIEACMDAFELGRATQWTEALHDWCESQPDLVPYRGQCLVHRSQVLQAHGDWTDAAVEAERAREHLSHPAHPALGLALYQLGELHRLRGEFTEAEEAYRGASRQGREPAPGLALLRLAEGHLDAAVAAIRRMTDESRGLPGHTTMLRAAVDILLVAGDLQGARAAADELASIAAAWRAPVLAAVSADAAGCVLLAAGEMRTALTSLRRASAGWRELGLPYEEARTRVQIAVACRALGDHDAAELELTSARSVFEQLGARPELARMANPVAAAENPTVLTERECEVLRLVAAGKTNRDISADLVISEHTVARHVQNIFTKLGLSSRSAATAYAYEHHLV
jgi:DNA-binding NarL/FixJ family response regulator